MYRVIDRHLFEVKDFQGAEPIAVVFNKKNFRSWLHNPGFIKNVLTCFRDIVLNKIRTLSKLDAQDPVPEGLQYVARLASLGKQGSWITSEDKQIFYMFCSNHAPGDMLPMVNYLQALCLLGDSNVGMARKHLRLASSQGHAVSTYVLYVLDGSATTFSSALRQGCTYCVSQNNFPRPCQAPLPPLLRLVPTSLLDLLSRAQNACWGDPKEAAAQTSALRRAIIRHCRSREDAWNLSFNHLLRVTVDPSFQQHLRVSVAETLLDVLAKLKVIGVRTILANNLRIVAAHLRACLGQFHLSIRLLAKIDYKSLQRERIPPPFDHVFLWQTLDHLVFRMGMAVFGITCYEKDVLLDTHLFLWNVSKTPKLAFRIMSLLVRLEDRKDVRLISMDIGTYILTHLAQQDASTVSKGLRVQAYSILEHVVRVLQRGDVGEAAFEYRIHQNQVVRRLQHIMGRLEILFKGHAKQFARLFSKVINWNPPA